MALFKIIFCDRAQILILILVLMTTMVIVSDALCNTMPVRDTGRQAHGQTLNTDRQTLDRGDSRPVQNNRRKSRMTTALSSVWAVSIPRLIKGFHISMVFPQA